MQEAPIVPTADINHKLAEIKRLLSEVTDGIDAFETKDVKTAVEKYVMIRGKLSTARKSFDEFETVCKQRQSSINDYLIGLSNNLGVDSFKTLHGTAYKTVKTSYRVDDWSEYAKWLLETENMQCVEKRAAKLAVKEIHDETGQIPPGLSLYQEIEFTVRKG